MEPDAAHMRSVRLARTECFDLRWRCRETIGTAAGLARGRCLLAACVRRAGWGGRRPPRRSRFPFIVRALLSNTEMRIRGYDVMSNKKH